MWDMHSDAPVWFGSVPSPGRPNQNLNHRLKIVQFGSGSVQWGTGSEQVY